MCAGSTVSLVKASNMLLVIHQRLSNLTRLGASIKIPRALPTGLQKRSGQMMEDPD